MPDTVLIATPALLGALSRQPDFSAALAFPDSDTVAALEAIVLRRPKLVALERLFAATARGAALIDRIRMDPALTACEIRIVAHEGTAEAPGPLSETVASLRPVPLAQESATDLSPELDEHGTRIVPRFVMPDGLEGTLDGRPVRLLDLSMGGAQVLTPLTLRPNQRVRLALPGPRRLRISSTVQWASFEMPREGPRYRAGLRFLDADAEILAQFIDANKQG